MDFLGLGPLEILVILVILIIVFGPMKLPEIAGQIGKTVREVRKATTDMTRQINQEIEASKRDIEAVKSDAKSAAAPIGDAVREVRKATTDMTRQMNQEIEASKREIQGIKSDLAAAASTKSEPAAQGPVLSPGSTGGSPMPPKSEPSAPQSTVQKRSEEQR